MDTNHVLCSSTHCLIGPQCPPSFHYLNVATVHTYGMSDRASLINAFIMLNDSDSITHLYKIVALVFMYVCLYAEVISAVSGGLHNRPNNGSGALYSQIF